MKLLNVNVDVKIVVRDQLKFSAMCTQLQEQLQAAGSIHPLEDPLENEIASDAGSTHPTIPPNYLTPFLPSALANPTSTNITSFRAHRNYDHNDQPQLQYLVQTQTNLLGQDLEFSLLSSITHPTSGSYFNGDSPSPISASTVTVSDSNNNNNTLTNRNRNLSNAVTYSAVDPATSAPPGVPGRVRSTDLSDNANMVLQSYDLHSQQNHTGNNNSGNSSNNGTNHPSGSNELLRTAEQKYSRGRKDIDQNGYQVRMVC
uniref:Uncharacterized protein n=1 Tax=Anopheles maculatus TaxID=74869 RepID=A0A182T640_9DIPT